MHHGPAGLSAKKAHFSAFRCGTGLAFEREPDRTRQMKGLL